MSALDMNESGVPQYPKGHVGRLLVTLAAIDRLERPTASSVAALTGLSKGKIDDYVQALNNEFGTLIIKDGPVYRLESWGEILKQSGVRKALTVPINGTNLGSVENRAYPRKITMPKSLSILDRSFISQKAAEEFFYQIRDANIASSGDIASGADFDVLRELYVKYCEYTNWAMPAEPVAFYARNIGRGSGAHGGTTQGFVVKFSDGKEKEFSAKKAVKAIADQEEK